MLADFESDQQTDEVAPRVRDRAQQYSLGVVVRSDAEIDRANRLYLLRTVHGQWQQKKAEKAENKAVEIMGKSSKGTCEVCGTANMVLRMNHQKNMCATCQSIYAHLHNRLSLVVDVLDAAGLVGDALGLVAGRSGKAGLVKMLQPYLPEQVGIKLENETLDRIAETVGYQGESGEGLIAKVGEMAASVFGYQEERERHGRFLVELREILGQTTGPVDDLLPAVQLLVDADQRDEARLEWMRRELWRVLKTGGDDEALVAAVAHGEALVECMMRGELCRVLGGGDLAEMSTVSAVAHSEAILDAMMRLAGDLAHCHADLPLLLDLQGQELHNMRINLQAKQDRISALVDQVQEDEQRMLADEQVFARIREVVDADGVANGDLPTAISSLLYAVGDFPAKRGANPALGSRLLDLLLDFPEIGVERIAEIKEVA